MAKKIKRRRPVAKTVEETQGRHYEFIGLFLFAAGIITLISLLGFNVGFIGQVLNTFLRYLFGIGVFIVPFFIMLFGIGYIVRKKSLVLSKRLLGMLLVYVLFLGIYQHFSAPVGQEIMPDQLAEGGGLLGGLLLFFLRKIFGSDGTLVVLLTLELGAVLFTTKWSLARGIIKTKEHTVHGMQAARDTLASTYERVREAEVFSQMPVQSVDTDPYQIEGRKESFYDQGKDGDCLTGKKAAVEMPKEIVPEPEAAFAQMEVQSGEASDIHMQFAFDEIKTDDMEDTLQIDGGEMQAALEEAGSVEKISAHLPDKQDIAVAERQPAALLPTHEESSNGDRKLANREYSVPRIEDILQKPAKKGNSQIKREITENAKIIEKTLESFHVKAKIVNACHGPAVTRYELELAPGIKVSKITGLSDDLALSLAASGVRIEAPIPGKAAIGIEVPNKELNGVHLREVLEQPEFLEQPSRMTVGLGKDISGKAILADIGKMPHMLVAGATGSGKSVCINTLITSILFKAKPDEVKFILIDPKMVELSNYNGIPHLMVPVVVDSMKASSVLKWAVQEMEKRYARFAAAGVRDMGRYNKMQAPQDGEKMPAIIIIIDELADLMMVAAKDVEDSICRLAQKARAAGIHLVLATQRPSVDIITGVIKANIPSRISFAVSSQIDSRTILDAPGAEKLLGKGDMLYYPSGMSKPLRVQGAFISDDEVANLISYVKQQGEPEENEEIKTFTENDLKTAGQSEEVGGYEDECMAAALQLVLDTGSASASFLQRRLRVGYNRAARLVEQMEEMKIVGPANGSKPRELIMSREQLEHLLAEKNT